jgi:hypothetical protein
MLNFKKNLYKINKFVYKNDENIILFCAITLSVGFFFFFYKLDLITAYGDSRAHSNISRRVVDSLTPGLAQLGGSWLPLLHVLMLPTIWIDFMWHSGISGALVNMPAYILSIIFLYKLIYSITATKLNAFLGILALGTNINILYFQATPMGEMLFVSTLIISLYFLYKWQTQLKLGSLIMSALFLCLSSLNRYEGWFVVIAATIAVFLSSLIKLGKRKAESNLIIFGSLAVAGIVLWLLWHLIIFGDPLDFLKNEYSAGLNTARDIEAGLVPTYKNIEKSFWTEIYASFHTSGLILTILGFTCTIIFILKRNIKLFKSPIFILLISLIPFFFEILVVYSGKVPVYVPEVKGVNPTQDFFNVRYALYFLPGLIIFMSIFTKIKMLVLLMIFSVLINNLTLLPVLGNNKILALKDWGNLSGRESLDVQSWFKKNYDSGLILVSVAGSDALIFKTGLPMKKFISEGNSTYWKESLKNPNKYNRWVLIQNSGRDVLLRHLDFNILKKQFELKKELYDNNKWIYRIYKVKSL